MPTFAAKIYKIGINPVVDPPEDVLKDIFEQAGRSKGPIPVRGRLTGADYVQTLVKYRGAWRLYVNGPMLKSAGLAVGDIAEVEIEFDPAPRKTAVPPRFARALADDAAAGAAFNSLSPSRQNEILKYLGFLKTEASLERNIAKVLKQLKG
jgi:hypothetical protein